MKIAICIPCYGDPKGKFVNSLCRMLNHFHAASFTDQDGNSIRPEVEVFMVSSSMLTQSRHKLVAEALYWEADYLLWLDADHVFPRDTLARLWAHNLPIVGCNYARREVPTAPTAAKHVNDDMDHKNLVYTTLEKAQAGEVEAVDHIGFGVCLMDMRVLDVLEKAAEDKGEKNFLPLFQFETNGSSVIGEDVFFFKKLRDAGITVFCDHALSWEVGHIHDTVMTNAHAIIQKDRWLEARQAARERYEHRIEQLEAAE